MHEKNPPQAIPKSDHPVSDLLQTERWPRRGIDEVDGPLRIMLDQLASIQGYFPAAEAPTTGNGFDTHNSPADNTTRYALFKLAVTLQTWGLSHEARIADTFVDICKKGRQWFLAKEESLGAVEDPQQTPQQALLPFQLVPGRRLFAGMLAEYATENPEQTRKAYDECYAQQAEAYRASLRRYMDSSRDTIDEAYNEACTRIPDTCVTVRQDIAVDTVEKIEEHMQEVRRVMALAVVQGRGDDEQAVRFLKQTDGIIASILEASKTDPDIRRRIGELLLRQGTVPSVAEVYAKAREIFTRHMVDGLHNALVREADALTAGRSRRSDLMPVPVKLPSSSEGYSSKAVAYAQRTLEDLAASGITTVGDLFNQARRRLHPDQSGMSDTFAYLTMLHQEGLLASYIKTEGQGQQKTAQQ